MYYQVSVFKKNPNEKEMSINPYWVLRYIEKSKVKCYTEE